MKGMTRNDYSDFAERYLTIHQTMGDEVMAICPFHDDHNASFQFNTKKGLYYCFSCHASGTIRKLESRFGVSHRSMGVGLDVLYRAIGDLERPQAPELFMREEQLAQYRIDTSLWEDRGLNKDTIDKFDLGYDFIRDAMTIPMRNLNGDLLGLCRRYMDPDMRNRYRYPKGFHKREHLFASRLIADMPKTPPVCLTEGAIDTMTVWQAGMPAMAIYGSSVSTDQIRQMRLLGVREVTMFFDRDKAGREVTKRCLGWKKNDDGSWTRKRSSDLRRWFNVRSVEWNEAPRYAKDANDLAVDTIRKMLANAPAIR